MGIRFLQFNGGGILSSFLLYSASDLTFAQKHSLFSFFFSPKKQKLGRLLQWRLIESVQTQSHVIHHFMFHLPNMLAGVMCCKNIKQVVMHQIEIFRKYKRFCECGFLLKHSFTLRKPDYLFILTLY